MIGKLSDVALFKLLKLYNKIWAEGKLPSAWKHSIVIPVGKPGKDRSEATNYRPIALTSNMCKIMERMITSRLTYEIENRGLVTPHQSGFRKGRTTMDSLLCLESEIRKAQINKEVVIAVFIDVEKAYDMLWKEGLLIKLKNMGIRGRIYNWVLDFLFERKIQVRVGTSCLLFMQLKMEHLKGVCVALFYSI